MADLKESDLMGKYLEYYISAVTHLKSETTDDFVSAAAEKYLCALDSLKKRRHLPNSCFHTALAFTHNLEMHFRKFRVTTDLISQFAKTAASARNQSAKVSSIPVDKFTYPSLSAHLNGAEVAWIFYDLFQSPDKPEAHVIGVFKNEDYPEMFIWDTGRDNLMYEQTHEDTMICTLGNGELYSRVRRKHELNNHPILIASFYPRK